MDSKQYKLLISAANELACYIADTNNKLQKHDNFTNSDYHDFQTCQELLDIANSLYNVEDEEEKIDD